MATRRNNKRAMTLEGASGLARLFNELPFNIQRKIVAPTLRKVARSVILPDAIANMPTDSGALSKSLTVKAAKTSKAMSKRGQTKVGSVVAVDGKRLVKHMRSAGASDARIQSATEKYFYPAGIEIGNVHTDARRPMTRALMQAAPDATTAVRKAVQDYVYHEAARLTSPSASGDAT